VEISSLADETYARRGLMATKKISAASGAISIFASIALGKF
jgi:hypothetical protein